MSLYYWASLVAQRLKHLPPMRKSRVQSLGQEDPLEKEMAIHSGILAWRIPWTEKSMRSQSRTRLSNFTSPQPHYLLIGFLSFKIYLEYLSMSKEYKYVNLFTEFSVIKIILLFISSIFRKNSDSPSL